MSRRRLGEQPDAVYVSPEVLCGLDAARVEGTNMLNVRSVAAACKRLGFAEAAAWVRRNPDSLLNGYFLGFTPEGRQIACFLRSDC